MEAPPLHPVLSSVLGVVLLASTGCVNIWSPDGDGGEDSDADVPESTTIELEPPPTLTLEGQSISEGKFAVTEATAYEFQNGNKEETEVLSASDDPIVVDTTIGQGSHDLFEVPGSTEAIDVKGYFDSTRPNLDRAQYDMTVFGTFAEPIEFTVFLPKQTSESAKQITGSGESEVLDDNINKFTDQQILPSAYPSIAGSGGSNPGQINPDAGTLGNVSQSSTSMTAHGRVRSSPPVGNDQGDQFQCGDGSQIDASNVCNGTEDCPGGSDEGSDTCGTESRCCVNTNGCPAETGSNCAQQCCCCGIGQICDQSNPANGCVSAQ